MAVEYPVRIETSMGSIESGWSENQRDRDPLLIGTYLEQMATTLITLHELYEQHQPASALQFQMNLLLNCTKAQKQRIRANRKSYDAQQNDTL